MEKSTETAVDWKVLAQQEEQAMVKLFQEVYASLIEKTGLQLSSVTIIRSSGVSTELELVKAPVKQ